MQPNRPRDERRNGWGARIAILLVLLVAVAAGGNAQAFDYGPVVASAPQTLFLSVQSVGPGGSVEINGVDTAPLTGPFHWDWGDGASNTGWFPQQHTYADTGRNYVVAVTSFHQDATTQHASAIVFFVPAAVVPVPLPPDVSVEIPSQPVVLQSHYVYPPPGDLVPLADSVFTTYSRGAMAQVLRAVAVIQKDLANDDVFLTDGDFAQVALQNASYGGGISFWFTTPMAAGFGAGIVASPSQWFILFNELGKNTTLNTPGALPYGGNTDGNASEIYSETMGAIMSYAAGYELVNRAAAFGLGSDAAAEIGNSLLAGAANLRQQYEAYVAAGAPFSSWNPYDGSPDPTLGTVATLAYKFIEHAEAQGAGHRLPAKRLLRCLQTFDPAMLASYDPHNDTVAGATWRSTLMVKALSFAFETDLRGEFIALNFPIDDDAYAAICADLPPSLIGAASRKVHGVAGTFDLPLAATPTGPATEPRWAGAGGTHTIVFAFDQTVTSAVAAVVEGAATAGTPTFSGNEVSVPLSNAGDAQYVTVAVSAAHASATGLEGAGSARVGFLAGDVNGTRNVSLADLLGVNAVLTQLVAGTNFLRDVTVSGSLTLSDLLAVNARLTQVLPPP